MESNAQPLPECYATHTDMLKRIFMTANYHITFDTQRNEDRKEGIV